MSAEYVTSTGVADRAGNTPSSAQSRPSGFRICALGGFNVKSSRADVRHRASRRSLRWCTFPAPALAGRRHPLPTSSRRDVRSCPACVAVTMAPGTTAFEESRTLPEISTGRKQYRNELHTCSSIAAHAPITGGRCRKKCTYIHRSCNTLDAHPQLCACSPRNNGSEKDRVVAKRVARSRILENKAFCETNRKSHENRCDKPVLRSEPNPIFGHRLLVEHPLHPMRAHTIVALRYE